ncbi:dnaJ homolog subfamily C member 11 isoform X1 [Petromyzon marinus]
MDGWEVVERRRTPAEILEEFERLQSERDERRLQQRTNPKGTVTVGVDATDLFEPYEDDYEDGEGGRRWLPHVEVNRMSISQSIEAPLTLTDTAFLSGSLSSHNGNGSGTIAGSVRRVTSPRGWCEMDFFTGDMQSPSIGVKGFRNLTSRCFVSSHASLQLVGGAHTVRPGLSTVLARRLDAHTLGYLAWRCGLSSSMSCTAVRDTAGSTTTFCLQLGIPNTFGLLSFQYKFQDDHKTRLRALLKVGVFGAVLEYGAERRVSRHSTLGAAVCVGVPQGVTLRLKLHRASQSYVFPIHLTESLLPSAVFYASAVPLVAFLALERLLIRPYLRAQGQRELAKRRENSASNTEKSKLEAEAAVRLMQESVKRIVEAEEAKMGLVIIHAWYGRLITDASGRGERPHVIDVTTPLQCLVRDSKLILTDARKAGLPGFYDPCVGEEKALKVLYQFRGALHQVTVPDTESLRIPKQSHRFEEN